MVVASLAMNLTVKPHLLKELIASSAKILDVRPAPAKQKAPALSANLDTTLIVATDALKFVPLDVQPAQFQLLPPAPPVSITSTSTRTAPALNVPT